MPRLKSQFNQDETDYLIEFFNRDTPSKHNLISVEFEKRFNKKYTYNTLKNQYIAIQNQLSLKRNISNFEVNAGK